MQEIARGKSLDIDSIGLLVTSATLTPPSEAQRPTANESCGAASCGRAMASYNGGSVGSAFGAEYR